MFGVYLVLRTSTGELCSAIRYSEKRDRIDNTKWLNTGMTKHLQDVFGSNIDERPSSFHTVNSNSLQLNFTFHGYIVMTNVKAIRSSARCNVIIPACVTRSDEKRSIRAGATSCSQKR